MEDIIKQYIVDSTNRKIAVQIDIGVFEKIENILEDHGLFKLMEENDESDNLDLSSAEKFYKGLDKANWSACITRNF